MKNIKYIADLELNDLPNMLVKQLNGVDWDAMDATRRLREMSYCVSEIYLRLDNEICSSTRKDLFSQIRLLNKYMKLDLYCKSTYILITNDEYELPVLVFDRLEDIAECLGISFMRCFQAFMRNTILFGQYRIKKINLVEPQDNFNFISYKKYCEDNGLSVSNFQSLSQFKSLCFGGLNE